MIMQPDTLTDWRISKRTALLLFAVPLVGLLLIAAAHFLSEEVWRKIDEEDGPIESLQFAGLFVSSLVSGAIAYRLFSNRQLITAVLYSLAGLGLFFVAGEEIAWGQRILHFETPETLAEVNEKREVSVHNVGSLSELFNVGKFFVGLYGGLGWCVLAWLAPRRDVRGLELFVVPWFLSSAFLVILAQRILRWTILQGSVPRGYGEFDESCFVFGVTAFLILVWRRLRVAGRVVATN